MGQVILPSHEIVHCDGVSGKVSINQLILYLSCDEHTISFLISTIGALGMLGKHAKDAIPHLETHCTGDNTLLKTAASHAIQKIKNGMSSNTSYVSQITSTISSPPPYSPPNYSSTDHYMGGFENHHQYYGRKPEIKHVTFSQVESVNLEDGLKTWQRCSFCNKLTESNPSIKKYNDMLTNKFYCQFCMKNDFFSFTGKNTMAFSFKGVAGYYFYCYHVVPKVSAMFTLDIKDMIERHCIYGNANPLFKYDPETMNWYIDFSKVGNKKNQMPIEEILKILVTMCASFQIYESVRGIDGIKFFNKFRDATLLFYNERKRARKQKVFTPTFYDCGIPAGHRGLPIHLLQNFSPSHLDGFKKRN